MLGSGVLGFAPAEHFYLVKLVDADDAAGVFAVGTGLPAEAGGPPSVAFRTCRQVDDLPLVVACERDLGGAYQV